MRQPEIFAVSFRYCYLLRLKKSKLACVASPLHPSANMQCKEDRASEHQGHARDHKSNRHPTQARHHHYQKTITILAADQINAGQPAYGSQPIYTEELHSFLRHAAYGSLV